MLDRLLSLAHGDGQRVAAVGDHLVGIELHAPGVEQRGQVRGLVGAHGRHRVLRVGAGVVGLGQRIDEHQDVAAAQRELVDGELRRRRQILRMHQHQHVHVRVDVRGARLERPQVEQLLRLGVDGPRLAHLSGLRIEARAHRQRGQPGDHRLLGVGELVDELDDVVLEELLLVRIEELDGGMAVGGVGAGEAEVELRAAGAERRAAHAELGGAVLLLGERLRVDDVQAQLAAGAAGELLEELAHPHAVGLQLRQLPGGLLREEEVQVDRLLDARQDPVGAGRGGVQVVLGEIQPPAAQRVVEEHREADEQQGERRAACRRRVSSVCSWDSGALH